MREARFRAWDRVQKKMTYYVTVCSEGDEWWWYGDHKYPDSDDTMCSFDDNAGDLMQYTGKEDKDGKKIYKGDILRDDVGEIYEAKFGELPLGKAGDCVCTYQSFYAKCYGKLGLTPFYECIEIANWMEIIGNIYESPELLK